MKSNKFNVGDKAYYKSILGLKEVEIIDKELESCLEHYQGYVAGVHRHYNYLIRFKSGRLKIVKREKLF